MLVGVPAEKSQDTFSFSPSVQQPKVALGVHKDSGYTNRIMSLHSQDREHMHQYQLQCLQEERQSGTLFALGLCLSISYITFIFKTKTSPPFSLQTQGGQKWGGRSSEGCYKVYFVPGIHISHDGPGKLHYLPLLEWESKISGISTALSYMQCNCLYK